MAPVEVGAGSAECVAPVLFFEGALGHLDVGLVGGFAALYRVHAPILAQPIRRAEPAWLRPSSSVQLGPERPAGRSRPKPDREPREHQAYRRQEIAEATGKAGVGLRWAAGHRLHLLLNNRLLVEDGLALAAGGTTTDDGLSPDAPHLTSSKPVPGVAVTR